MAIRRHYAYGEIKVMASDDEHMGVFLELKGAGSRNMEYVLQAQEQGIGISFFKPLS
mgnify:CR=1 FL=1